MNHHNALDRFASRGLKAQQAVDKIISSAAPASSTAAGGDANEQRAAGGTPTGRPRSPDLLSAIADSKDENWLKRLMVDRDQTPAVRQAAQKRLRKMMRRPRL